MFDKSFDNISLRKKLGLLALLPAIAVSVLLSTMAAFSAHSASSLVRQSVTKFMIERTSRSLAGGQAYMGVSARDIQTQSQLTLRLAQVVLGSRGGVSLGGAPVMRTLIGDGEHMGGTVAMPPMHIGTETIVSGRSEVIQSLSDETWMVVLFQRIGSSNDFVRVSSSLPAVQLGSFMTNKAPQGSPAATVASGNNYWGRTTEGGEWHLGIYEPLWDKGGKIIGAMYFGRPVAGLANARSVLTANKIGNLGSVSILFSSGQQRGTFVEPPTGIAAETRSTWYPVVLADGGSVAAAGTRGLIVHSDASDADAIVRYTYAPSHDWIIVTVADSRDLQDASSAVRREFTNLSVRSFLLSVLVLAGVAVLAWLLSRRIVGPLQEITIQLTSNGTQVASTVHQQMAHANNVNVSSTEIATAVKQISATSQELLHTMEGLSVDSAQASQTANQGAVALQDLGNANEMLWQAAQKIESSFAAMGAQANKINSVTLAVTKVADQTNLLSLNAAIEAEKAGEAGAGFAVVAREIRRLADQSANSSQQIESTIDEMQKAMNSGIGEVRALSKAVEQNVQMSERIQQQFAEIIERVGAMTPRYEMVHLGMQNQAEGAKQISEAMWQLTESAGQTAEAIAELKDVSLSLHGAVDILKRRMFADKREEAAAAALANDASSHEGRME